MSALGASNVGLRDAYRELYASATSYPGYTLDENKNSLVPQFSEGDDTKRIDYMMIANAGDSNTIGVTQIGVITDWTYQSPSVGEKLDCSDHYPLEASLVINYT